MHTILLLADIHANFPALEAVARAAQADRCDAIINCGDSLVYHAFPNQTLDWLRARANSTSILGNTDVRVLKLAAGKSIKRPRKPEKRLMYQWTLDRLSPENLNFLGQLPKSAGLRLDGHKIGIFHGSPDELEEALFPDTDPDRFRQLAAVSACEVVVTGHSHVPYALEVGGVLFINPGSVGRMFDGNPEASCAILRLDGKKAEVEHLRVAYEVDRSAQALIDHGLPAIYASMCRQGRKLN